MNRFLKLGIALLGVSLTSACASAPPPADPPLLTMLTPMPTKPIDPTTEQMQAAITRVLKNSQAPAFAKYQYHRYDLDGDGRRDAIVLLQNPYKYWCNIHGCTLLVMKASDNDFRLVSKIQPIRAPFYVSPLKTNGWHDLIVRVSGRWDKTKNVAMKFDGYKYPYNPESLPAYNGAGAQRVSAIFP